MSVVVGVVCGGWRFAVLLSTMYEVHAEFLVE